MIKELEQKVTNILKSSKSKQDQSVEIFFLAEAAWSYGDITAYESLMKLLRKFFPELEVKELQFSLNPLIIQIGTLPNIDLETHTKEEVLEHLNIKYPN